MQQLPDLGFFSASFCRKNKNGKFTKVVRKHWNNTFQLSHTDTGVVWGVGEQSCLVNFLETSKNPVNDDEKRIAEVWGSILEFRQYFKELHKQCVVDILLANKKYPKEYKRLIGCLHFLPKEYRDEILSELN